MKLFNIFNKQSDYDKKTIPSIYKEIVFQKNNTDYTDELRRQQQVNILMKMRVKELEQLIDEERKNANAIIAEHQERIRKLESEKLLDRICREVGDVSIIHIGNLRIKVEFEIDSGFDKNELSRDINHDNIKACECAYSLSNFHNIDFYKMYDELKSCEEGNYEVMKKYGITNIKQLSYDEFIDEIIEMLKHLNCWK